MTWQKGRKYTHSPETRKKIGEANKRFYAQYSDAPKGNRGRKKGSVVTQETREKLRKHFAGKPAFKIRGENHPSWKGGITPENHKIRTSLEYKNWRKAVFERDNYTCIWCGIRSGKGTPVILHADHIKQFAYYPALRFEVSNGRTLCKECHKKTDTFNFRRQKNSPHLDSCILKQEALLLK